MENGGFDSKEEYWIYLYLLELKEEGYILDIICQPDSFKLYEGLPKKFFRLKQLKTKVSKKYTQRKNLINPHEYTADFRVYWDFIKATKFIHEVTDDEKNLDIPFIVNEFYDAISNIEVKGSFDRNNATRLFTSRTQPWVWQKFGVYVQLIKPLELFKETFIPKAILPDFYYKKTGKWGLKGSKKYKWEYKTLKEYINGK